MIDLLRQIILSVTAASLFGAVVLAIVPEGAMKEVLRMGTGLILIVSLVIPMQKYAPQRFRDFLPRIETTQMEDSTQLFQQEMIREIEAETADYAEQLAQQSGISCQAQVSAQIQTDNQVVITQISLKQEGNADLSQLQQTLAQQLGISADRIFIQ
ncbi:hypothetical protein [Butyricicoccus sp.]|uniref:hypothetical protein n=1 Tax=Butyricicoccus sp. TaxID=2049021 RepID=UPI003D7D82C5